VVMVLADTSCNPLTPTLCVGTGVFGSPAHSCATKTSVSDYLYVVIFFFIYSSIQ
jgi:hypothetical protein